MKISGRVEQLLGLRVFGGSGRRRNLELASPKFNRLFRFATIPQDEASGLLVDCFAGSDRHNRGLVRVLTIDYTVGAYSKRPQACEFGFKGLSACGILCDVIQGCSHSEFQIGMQGSNQIANGVRNPEDESRNARTIRQTVRPRCKVFRCA